MGNAQEVSGPKGPLHPTGVREKRLPSDPEAFQKKLDKIGEADPEQKKKRRHQEEETEEAKATMKEAHKLAKTKDMIAPFEIGKKLTSKPSLTKGAPTAVKAEAKVTPPLAEGAETDESLFWEEEEFVLPEELEVAPKEEGTAAAPTPIAPPTKKRAAPVKEEKGEEVLPLEKGEARKKEAKKKVPAAPKKAIEAPAAPPTPAVQISAPPALESLSYAQLSPQVLDLFERMAGVMTVMVTSGISETTVSLTSDQFSSSMFFGAEIVIREYSTAPKQFNIEVRGNPEAVALFQANIPYIEKSFQTGNYNFGIHRMEASISRIEEEPVSDKEREEREKEGREER